MRVCKALYGPREGRKKPMENEMNEKINQLHDEVINYEKVLADAKNERELLLSQIEMLEKNNKK